MVSGAGVLATSKNKEVAGRFLEFMLSKVGQQYFAGQTFEYPLVEGINTPRSLVPLSDINRPGVLLTDLADLKGTQDLLSSAGVMP